MGRAVKVGVVAAVSFVVACTSILGDLEVAPPGAFGVDSGSDGQQQPQQQQQQQDASTDGGQTIVRACERETDCPDVPTTPAGCAVAQCTDHKCVYVAVDKDLDGHPFAGCNAGGTLLPGDDCADDAPTIFPGGACAKRPDGSDIAFPNGTPLGACKAGKWDCATGKATCQGAIAPLPAENCALKNDANCDGTPDDGCDCTTGASGPCGNVGNLPLPCTKGTRECKDGKWGACTGNVEPKARDCSSIVDNDCNGAKDQGEAACSCPGNVAQGGKTACAVGGALGACADGTSTCQPSPDKQSGVFGPCQGPRPGAKECKSAEDFDCNGLSDELEVECGSPCTVPKTGAPITAAQRFHSSLWGCGGTSSWDDRSIGCAKGWTVCSAEQWTKYIRSLSSKPPTHKYWVQEKLNYGGNQGTCFAPVKGGTDCGASASMTVCPYAKGGASVTDAEGNVCNWSGCSYGDSVTANDFFGGCAGPTNATGGTLCCPL